MFFKGIDLIFAFLGKYVNDISKVHIVATSKPNKKIKSHCIENQKPVSFRYHLAFTPVKKIEECLPNLFIVIASSTVPMNHRVMSPNNKETAFILFFLRT